MSAINSKNMSLTQQDLSAIEEVIKKHVDRVEAKVDRVEAHVDRVEAKVDASKEELLEEIRKVGIEVVENRSIILQHIQNNPAWKH